MVTVRAAAGLATLWLLDAALAQAPAVDAGAVDAVLAAFPDNGLPRLLARLDQRDPAVYAELAALGPAAHEALLGMMLRIKPRDPGLLTAFGGFDAHAASALPLLTNEFTVLDETPQELLCRLGPGAAPALAGLQALAAGKHPGLAPFVARLAKATDAPLPPGAAPVRPRVGRDHVPALLARLQHGPAAQRWPALQALLCAGDEAATAAAELLVEMALEPTLAPVAAELALTLCCVQGTRCLPGHDPLAGVTPSELPTEARRLVLAQSWWLRPEAAHAWSTSPDPSLRRTAVLAALLHRESPFAVGIRSLPTTDPDPAVQGTIDRLHRVLRLRGAVAAREVLAVLATEPPPAEAQKAIERLRDLRDAPDELWPALCRLASGPDAWVPDPPRAADPPGQVRYRQRTRLGRVAAENLSGMARVAGPLPAGLLAALPLLEPCRENEQMLRELLAAAGPEQVAAQIRAASDDTAALARWFAVLRGANDRQRAAEVLRLLGDGLVAEVSRLPAAAQLDWLELGPEQLLPESDWLRLLGSADVVVRRRAIEAAWRGFPKRSLDLAHVLPMLDDADFVVARSTTLLCSACRNDPQRAATAVAALARRFPTATPELQEYVIMALLGLREHAAAARATLDAAFASDTWQVRLGAAHVLLAIEPEHAAAWQALVALVGDARREVRERALYQGGNVPVTAVRLVDLAIERLDDPDQQVQYAAVRLLGAARAAKERSLPALRAFVERRPHGNAADRARSVIADLEKPPADPIPARR